MTNIGSGSMVLDTLDGVLGDDIWKTSIGMGKAILTLEIIDTH